MVDGLALVERVVTACTERPRSERDREAPHPREGEAVFSETVTCFVFAHATALPIRETTVVSMRRTILQRIHNPSGRLCRCDPACWCKRTAWGRALRWYLPKRHLSVSPEWKRAQEPG
jgi:hypothetical protein